MEVIGGRNALSTSHHLRKRNPSFTSNDNILAMPVSLFATCDQFRLSNFVNS